MYFVCCCTKVCVATEIGSSRIGGNLLPPPHSDARRLSRNRHFRAMRCERSGICAWSPPPQDFSGALSGALHLRNRLPGDPFVEEKCSENCRRRYPSERPLRQVRRCFLLAEVRVQEGEPLENALRRFKRKVQTEDIIKEVKRHSFYLKPGEKRRVKEALARKRNRKKVRKEQD